MAGQVFITNHVLAGALIGAYLPPMPALAAGFASHLVMDNLPHYGTGGVVHIPTARRDGVLGLAGIACCAALARPDHRLSVLAGITGACLPDLDKVGEHFVGASPFPQQFDRFHKWLQREAAHRLPHEIAVGLGLAAIAASRLRRRRHGAPAEGRSIG